jgi:hypothetical protein
VMSPGNTILPAAAGVAQTANWEIGVPGFQAMRFARPSRFA